MKRKVIISAGKLGTSKPQWKRQEKRVAKSVAGKVRVCSGALPNRKGDVFSDVLLIECKVTKGQSVSVKKKWLEKITKEAFESSAEGRIPALVFGFSEMAPGVAKDWIAVPTGEFEALTGLTQFDPKAVGPKGWAGRIVKALQKMPNPFKVFEQAIAQERRS